MTTEMTCLASGGGGYNWCDKDHCVYNGVVTAWTNGQSLTYTQNGIVIFNCKDYSTYSAPSTIGVFIWGINDTEFVYLGDISTNPQSCANYDYLLVNRAGANNNMSITFA